MDTYFDLSRYDNEDLHACVASCGRADRLQSFFEKVDNNDICETEKIFSNTPGRSDDDRDEQINKGMKEWLLAFHHDTASFSLSNTGIKNLHRKLFKYSRRDEGYRGIYRKDLEDKMKALFEETKESLLRKDRHSLLIISIFRIAFIRQMPFITGNVLCANLLSYALLSMNGYSHVCTPALLASLNNAESGTSQERAAFLAETVCSIMESSSFKNKQSKKDPRGPYISLRRRIVLSCVQQNAPVKISDIMRHLPGENRNTLKKDLLFLKEQGLISALGTGRGVSYTTENN